MSLAQALGVSVPFCELDGVQYFISIMSMNEWAQVEEHIVSLINRNPIEIAEESLKTITDPALRKDIIDRAWMDAKRPPELNRPSAEEVQRYVDTLDGLFFTTRLLLRQNHPDITMEKVREIYQKLGHQRFMRARDRAAGIGELGNSPSPQKENAS